MYLVAMQVSLHRFVRLAVRLAVLYAVNAYGRTNPKSYRDVCLLTAKQPGLLNIIVANRANFAERA